MSAYPIFAEVEGDLYRSPDDVGARDPFFLLSSESEANTGITLFSFYATVRPLRREEEKKGGPRYRSSGLVNDVQYGSGSCLQRGVRLRLQVETRSRPEQREKVKDSRQGKQKKKKPHSPRRDLQRGVLCDYYSRPRGAGRCERVLSQPHLPTSGAGWHGNQPVRRQALRRRPGRGRGHQRSIARFGATWQRLSPASRAGVAAFRNKAQRPSALMRVDVGSSQLPGASLGAPEHPLDRDLVMGGTYPRPSEASWSRLRGFLGQNTQRFIFEQTGRHPPSWHPEARKASPRPIVGRRTW